MSLPRCALLWARLPAGRGAGPQTAASSALRALVGPFPGALGRAPCLAASSSASGGSKAPNTSLFVPLTVKPLGPSADGDVGAELTRPLDKNEVKKILDRFYKRQEIQKLSADSGLDARLFHQAFISFRNYIMQSHSLDVDIHIVLNDICFSAGKCLEKSLICVCVCVCVCLKAHVNHSTESSSEFLCQPRTRHRILTEEFMELETSPFLLALSRLSKHLVI
ncbi:ATP-dependent RNA helicase SUPV3L1, mitochondrial-like [Psammomys obesus]|uniref:ATP-dependent RNA helicase SUPV3L1, mitochondrial-like n=1 Tax=Psammomys obesus TaxID=48139 RepID=UPI002452A063|nr:ATP-dependent RNA helicase SUPV3L1, mitochondrial-like [Psammomys obesus]